MNREPHSDLILETKNLSKQLKDIKAVDDLSFNVREKDIYGFLGPNGSGKSTTIRMLLSLIRPDRGQITIFGLPLQTNRLKILRNIGAFIEKPDFYEYLSAYKNLELLAAYSGIRSKYSDLMQNLELVGLKERAESKVKTFSKGMKQRLGIAQALIHDPELLILDEPASGLDPSGNRDIRNLIRYLNKEKGKTIILSSHNLGEIEMIANRMIIINKGRKVIEGEVNTLLTAQSYRTTLSLDDVEKAADILRESNILTNSLIIRDNMLHIQCTRASIPDINALLVSKGIRVESIKVEQNLEDYFLNLT